MNNQSDGRRPLRSRDTGWAKAIAHAAASWGISPNSISLASIAFSAMGASALIYFRFREDINARAMLLVLTAAFIQLRLLCNLIDGMVAVEGGKKTPTGEIFNDLPDRLSDALILVPAGYVVPLTGGRELGWAAALLAIFTAYVRVLGASVGTRHYFLGPMAKPHRMAVMTLACFVGVFEVYRGWHGWTFAGALLLIIVGSTITSVRRTIAIAGELKSQ